jgi:hypothetical protein
MKHIPPIGIALLLFIAILLIVFKVNPQIAHDREVLIGVKHAGPCRAEGIKDAECRRQARLIFAACADQPVRCATVYGIKVVTIRPGPHHEGAVFPGVIEAAPGTIIEVEGDEYSRVDEHRIVETPEPEEEPEPKPEETPRPEPEEESPGVSPSAPLVSLAPVCAIAPTAYPLVSC